VALDESQLDVLGDVGREWDRVCDDPEVWRRALPVDPSLGSFPDPADIRPTRFGRFVPVQAGPLPAVQATSEAELPSGPLRRLGHGLRRGLLGPPLKSTAIARNLRRDGCRDHVPTGPAGGRQGLITRFAARSRLSAE
jgi:hypothetical protein